MKLKTKALCLLILASCSVAAQALTTTANARVNALVVRSQAISAGGLNTFTFTLERVVAEPGCATGGNVSIVLETGITNELAFKTMTAAVMTAYSAGRQLHVYTDGCVGGFPRVIGVDVL
jgi:hypothetical protein